METKFRTRLKTDEFPSFEGMADYVSRHYRNLELIELAPWDEPTHGGGVRYPTPVQYVKFDVPKPDLERPDRRRISVLIPRKRLL